MFQSGFPFSSFEERFVIASHPMICRRVFFRASVPYFPRSPSFDLESGRRLGRVNARACTTLTCMSVRAPNPLYSPTE